MPSNNAHIFFSNNQMLERMVPFRVEAVDGSIKADGGAKVLNYVAASMTYGDVLFYMDPAEGEWNSGHVLLSLKEILGKNYGACEGAVDGSIDREKFLSNLAVQKDLHIKVQVQPE